MDSSCFSMFRSLHLDAIFQCVPVMFRGKKMTNDKLMMGFLSSSITCFSKVHRKYLCCSHCPDLGRCKCQKSIFLSERLLLQPLPTNPLNTWRSRFTLECDCCRSPFQCYYSKLTFCLLFTEIHTHFFENIKVKVNCYITHLKNLIL